MREIERRRVRRLALWLGLFSLASASLLAFPASASHDGPILIVDATSPADEDHDGDRHFKTLQAALQGPPTAQAYDTILVEPGRYVGDVEIRVEGLTLRSTGGASQTILAGRVILRARNVRLEGFSIEGSPKEPAVLIAAPAVTLQGNRIYGSAIGVLIEGTSEISLLENQIYNQRQDGLIARDVWNLKLSENEVRGNGGLGLYLERSHDLVLEENAISFNQLGGVWLKGSQRAKLSLNVVRDNFLVGIALESTSDAQAEGNQLISNEVGLLLMDAVNNRIRANEIRQQRVAGLVLKNGAQGNSIEENVISGNQGRGAIGVRLAGSVASNRFLNNRVLENSVGIEISRNDTGGPANNIFEKNVIARSDGEGVRIEAGSGRNRFLANEIHQNLQAGLTSAGEGNIFEQNEIHHNGAAGVALLKSQDERLDGNRIYENGAEGVLLEGVSGALLANNAIEKNVRDGFSIEQGKRLRLFQNSLVSNGGSGLFAREIENFTLASNRLQNNREYGAFLMSGRDLLLEKNEIEANGGGGVRLEGVRAADLSANRVTKNLHYGLSVLNSEGISARRNFWGDEHGPAGAFAGAGNAVLGLPLEELTPWLPAEPAELVLSSVSALVIDSARGPRIQFDASDRLGLILELYRLGRGEPGRSELISQGIVLAARYAERPAGAPPLGLEMGFYSVTVEGIDAGFAELTVFYQEEDQPAGLDPERLKLYVLEDGRWVPLVGQADPKLKRVTGELELRRLDGRLIVLGMPAPQPEAQSSRDPQGGAERSRFPVGSLVVLTPLALLFFYFLYAPRSRFSPIKILSFRGNRP